MGGTLGVEVRGTLGDVVGGALGAAVVHILGARSGVELLVGTILGAVAGVVTSVGGSLEWWGRNSLVGTKGGS